MSHENPHALNQWQTICRSCRKHTSKRYAAAHTGQCRECAENIPTGIHRKDWIKMSPEEQAVARDVVRTQQNRRRGLCAHGNDAEHCPTCFSEFADANTTPHHSE